MSQSVVLDTTYLIALANGTDPLHSTASLYYKHFLENDIQLHLSSIVATEFGIRQPLTDLPLRNFIFLPFNYDDAILCCSLMAAYFAEVREKVGTPRVCVKDDFKIVTQTATRNSRLLITSDTGLYKICEHLRAARAVNFEPLDLALGFNAQALNTPAQIALDLPS
jgi:hypothetical protein